MIGTKTPLGDPKLLFVHHNNAYLVYSDQNHSKKRNSNGHNIMAVGSVYRMNTYS